MESKAVARFVRITPRKVKIVLDLIRGKSTREALAILENTKKRAAPVVNKLMRSAISNAKFKGLEEEGLYISRIFVADGPSWKRFRANAFGRGSRILKRTSHITVELDRKKSIPKPSREIQVKKIKTKKAKA